VVELVEELTVAEEVQALRQCFRLLLQMVEGQEEQHIQVAVVVTMADRAVAVVQ
jgi:hypothetical protein